MKKEEKVTKENKTPKFHIVETDSSISAGICGPDGCVLDWSKTTDK